MRNLLLDVAPGLREQRELPRELFLLQHRLVLLAESELLDLDRQRLDVQRRERAGQPRQGRVDPAETGLGLDHLFARELREVLAQDVLDRRARQARVGAAQPLGDERMAFARADAERHDGADRDLVALARAQLERRRGGRVTRTEQGQLRAARQVVPRVPQTDAEVQARAVVARFEPAGPLALAHADRARGHAVREEREPFQGEESEHGADASDAQDDERHPQAAQDIGASEPFDVRTAAACEGEEARCALARGHAPRHAKESA